MSISLIINCKNGRTTVFNLIHKHLRQQHQTQVKLQRLTQLLRRLDRDESQVWLYYFARVEAHQQKSRLDQHDSVCQLSLIWQQQTRQQLWSARTHARRMTQVRVRLKRPTGIRQVRQVHARRDRNARKRLQKMSWTRLRLHRNDQPSALESTAGLRQVRLPVGRPELVPADKETLPRLHQLFQSELWAPKQPSEGYERRALTELRHLHFQARRLKPHGLSFVRLRVLMDVLRPLPVVSSHWADVLSFAKRHHQLIRRVPADIFGRYQTLTSLWNTEVLSADLAWLSDLCVVVERVRMSSVSWDNVCVVCKREQRTDDILSAVRGCLQTEVLHLLGLVATVPGRILRSVSRVIHLLRVLQKHGVSCNQRSHDVCCMFVHLRTAILHLQAALSQTRWGLVRRPDVVTIDWWE